MGNVVLVTHWLDGDVIPFVRVGKELKERGHHVTLITHCHFEKMAREAGIAFEPLDTPKEYQELVDSMNGDMVERESELDEVAKEKKKEFDRKHESFEVRMKEYNKILKCCDAKDTVVLCKNRSSIAAYMVAEKLHLPLAQVMMNPTEILSSLAYDKLYPTKEVPLCNRLRQEVGLPPITTWLQWESSSKMTLAFWPEWYEKPNENWPRPVEAVGFPIEEGKEHVKREIPEEVKKWLAENEKPLLISGGTTKLINPLFYPLSLESCEILQRPTIVLTKYPELLPDKLPKNAIWCDFLPLDEIMPYLGAIIHHGGMGTLSGALRAGVPQMILPCYVDRPYNAALIKELGVGDFLHAIKWDAPSIAKATESLLNSSVREKCKNYSQKMRENRGISNTADKVEEMMNSTTYIYELQTLEQGEIKENTAVQKIERLSEQRKKELLSYLVKRRGENNGGN